MRVAATVNDGLTEDVLTVIAAVKELRNSGALNVTYDSAAKRLGWHRDKVSRKASVALKNGLLVNKQEKRRQPANLDLGTETPESRGLPTAERMLSDIPSRKGCVRAYVNAGAASEYAQPKTYAAYAADGTQDGARTHDVQTPGAYAEANENATYARTQPFPNSLPGSGGKDDGDDPIVRVEIP